MTFVGGDRVIIKQNKRVVWWCGVVWCGVGWGGEEGGDALIRRRSEVP